MAKRRLRFRKRRPRVRFEILPSFFKRARPWPKPSPIWGGQIARFDGVRMFGARGLRRPEEMKRPAHKKRERAWQEANGIAPRVKVRVR